MCAALRDCRAKTLRCHHNCRICGVHLQLPPSGNTSATYARRSSEYSTTSTLIWKRHTQRQTDKESVSQLDKESSLGGQPWKKSMNGQGAPGEKITRVAAKCEMTNITRHGALWANAVDFFHCGQTFHEKLFHSEQMLSLRD